MIGQDLSEYNTTKKNNRRNDAPQSNSLKAGQNDGVIGFEQRVAGAFTSNSVYKGKGRSSTLYDQMTPNRNV